MGRGIRPGSARFSMEKIRLSRRGRLGIKLEGICREEVAPLPWAGAHPKTSCRESPQPWGCGEAGLWLVVTIPQKWEHGEKAG